LILFLIVSRPNFLSLGTIEFVFSGLFFLFSAAFLFFCIKYRNEDFNFCSLDIWYGAVVAITILSFAVFSLHHRMTHQVYTVFAAFIIYLLIRLTYRHFFADKLTFAIILLVGAATIESVRGLLQFLFNSQMRGLFHNVNHFSMYIGMTIPLAVGILVQKKQNRLIRLAVLPALVVMLICVLLSRCRTVYMGLLISMGIMLAVLYRQNKSRKHKERSKFWTAKWSTPLVLAAGGLVWIFFQFKPLSAIGRFAIWKVSWQMFSRFPVFGIGFNNFPSLYNLYQGRFFSQGLGSEMERLSASHVFYAFNDYLESAVEFGVVGLFVFLVFWYLIIKILLTYSQKIYLSNNGMDSGAEKNNSFLVLGMAISVLFYMIISFFYYPSRILPIFLLFNLCLACVVSENVNKKVKTNKLGVSEFGKPFKLKALVSVSLSGLAVLLSAVLLPTFYHHYRAENGWRKAQLLEKEGSDQSALSVYEDSYPHLMWNGDFLHLYGLLLSRTDSTEEAIRIYEQGKKILPNPFLLEDLADAYAQKGDLDKAVYNASLASNILPWRLTSKFMLADYFFKLGDISQTAKFTQLVLDTPMKTWTPEGELLKEKTGRFQQNLIDTFSDSKNQRDKAISLLPDEYRIDAALALVTAGDNAVQMIEAIFSISPEMRRGLGFLITNMPESDLSSLSADYLVSNVRWAYLVRTLLPFNSDVPDNIFLNDVLPYAMVNESRDNWRADFFQRFHEAALESSSVEEAVFNLNAEVLSQFKLAFTELGPRKKPFSPYESFEQGYVSCTEASLLLVNACRSVGIPSRLVILPRWINKRVGHAWLEVYDNGQWHCIGSYDPSQFDVTWFSVIVAGTDPSKPENRIYATSFKKTDIHVKYGPDVSYVDVTHRYVSSQEKQKFPNSSREPK
jgi:O-antigen ligase